MTGSSSKNSIAVQRSLRRAFPDIYLSAHHEGKYNIAKLYRYADEILVGRPLDAVIADQNWDMIIPVDGAAVRTVAKMAPEKAVLPSPESIDSSFDKLRSQQLAERLGVPVPKTWSINNLADLKNANPRFPCVLKPADETLAKFVCFPRSQQELFDITSLHLHQPLHSPLLLQEYISGIGIGFFGLFNNGNPLRLFMHQRLREYPVTGGASTAAKAFSHAALKDYGLKLMKALRWHGVAMVEFKLDQSGDFYFIEINPKFWGSLDLAIQAGVDFPADLVRLYFGEQLNFSEKYNLNTTFYWPLDGDLLHLWETGQLRKAVEYFGKNSYTNLFESIFADLLKSLALIRRIVLNFWNRCRQNAPL